MKKMSRFLPFVFSLSLVPAGAFAQFSSDGVSYGEYSGAESRVERTVRSLSADISSKTASGTKSFSPIDEAEELKDRLYYLVVGNGGDYYTYDEGDLRDAIRGRSSPTESEFEKALKDELGKKLISMKDGTYTFSSLKDSNLVLSMGRFSGKEGNEGWPYEIKLRIGTQTVYKSEGFLLYSEISGKAVPRLPRHSSYEEQKDFNLYMDTVDVFEGLFERGSNFIDCTLTYTADPVPDASRYNIKIRRIDFTNILTEKNIKIVRCNESASYVSDVPLTVDLVYEDVPKRTEKARVRIPVKTGDEPKSRDVKVKKDRKEPQKRDKEVTLVNTCDKMDTYSVLLYCLPSTINYYEGMNKSFATVGYSVTYGFTDHFFGGLKLEGAFFQETYPEPYLVDGSSNMIPATTKNCYYPGDGDYYAYDGDCYVDDIIEVDTPLVFTGLLGFNWNIGRNFRMTTFGELGLVLDSAAIGSGLSIEYMLSDRSLSFSLSYACLATYDDIYNRVSVGVHKLF